MGIKNGPKHHKFEFIGSDFIYCWGTQNPVAIELFAHDRRSPIYGAKLVGMTNGNQKTEKDCGGSTHTHTHLQPNAINRILFILPIFLVVSPAKKNDPVSCTFIGSNNKNIH